MSEEQARLTEKDSELLIDLGDWMRAYADEVLIRGADPTIEMQKIKELVQQAIKVLANYL